MRKSQEKVFSESTLQNAINYLRCVTGSQTYLNSSANNRIYKTMTTTLQRRESANVWDRFCEWITSTNNRI
ncbi:MAG: hypothetical protein V7K26_07325, partial [Nostoc sp.]